MTLKKTPFLTALCLAGLMAFPVSADEKSMHNMVHDLQQLKAKALKERAADPWLLREMDKLIAKYEVSKPDMNRLLSVDFTQSNYQLKRQWSILSGKAWIARRSGLNLQASMNTRANNKTSKDKELSSEELGAAIFGALLNQALDIEEDSQTAESVEPELVVAAEVVKRVSIPQAFSLQTSFSGQQSNHQAIDLGFSLFQSSRAKHGYQLVISGEHNTEISLIKVLSGRVNRLKTVTLKRELGVKQHQLIWQQNARGEHNVYLNDELVLKIRSKRLRDNFKEFSILSQGKQIAIPFVTIDG